MPAGRSVYSSVYDKVSEADTDVPSSDDEKQFEDGCLVPPEPLRSEAPHEFAHLGLAPDASCTRHTDALLPCWLALHGRRVAIVQEAPRSLPDPLRRPTACISGKPLQMPLPVFSVHSGASHCPEDAVVATCMPGPGLSCVELTPLSARVLWTIAAGRLRSKDSAIVSPSFNLSVGRPLPFRLVLQAKMKSGKDNFGKAKGVGNIRLKCEAPLEGVPRGTRLEFSVCVGDQLWRGPVSTDLACEGVAGLPVEQQHWNFRAGIDAPSQTFTVGLHAVW